MTSALLNVRPTEESGDAVVSSAPFDSPVAASNGEIATDVDAGWCHVRS